MPKVKLDIDLQSNLNWLASFNEDQKMNSYKFKLREVKLNQLKQMKLKPDTGNLLIIGELAKIKALKATSIISGPNASAIESVVSMLGIKELYETDFVSTLLITITMGVGLNLLAVAVIALVYYIQRFICMLVEKSSGEQKSSVQTANEC